MHSCWKNSRKTTEHKRCKPDFQTNPLRNSCCEQKKRSVCLDYIFQKKDLRIDGQKNWHTKYIFGEMWQFNQNKTTAYKSQRRLDWGDSIKCNLARESISIMPGLSGIWPLYSKLKSFDTHTHTHKQISYLCTTGQISYHEILNVVKKVIQPASRFTVFVLNSFGSNKQGYFF